MCLICVDIIKGNITAAQARRNLGEMVLGKELLDEQQDHVEEVQRLIDLRQLLEQASSQ